MTQITVPPAMCNECRKEILAHISHHSLAQPDPGKTGFGILCHEEPVTGQYVLASFALKLALEQRAALLLKEAELKVSRTKYKSDTQANEAALKLKVETEANQQLEVTRLGLVQTHETLMKDLRTQLADAEQKLAVAEQKCSGLEALHDEKVNGLKSQIADLKQEVREAEKTSEVLLNEKTEVLEKLAESERTATELKKQVSELSPKVKLFDRLERALRKCRYEFRSMGIGAFSQSIRVGHLEAIKCRYEKLYGPLPEEPTQDLEMLLKSIEEDDDDAAHQDSAPPPPAPIATAPKAVTTKPVAQPAPKAAIATSTPKNGKPAFLVEVHTPVPQVAPVRTTVQFDATPSESDASADDDDDVDDRQVIEVKDADAKADTVSPKAPAHSTCTVCEDKPAVGRLRFVDKSTGEKKDLYTCDTNEHGEIFLRVLQRDAKGSNWSNLDANDISTLFR